MIENENKDIQIWKINLFEALQDSNFTFSKDFLFSIIEDL